MPYEVPQLAYAYDSLEPYIDAQTMQLHHDKHHGAYVNNLNKALEGHPDLAALPIEKLLAKINEVPEAIRGAVRNNGGGHANHSLFWSLMKRNDGAKPKGALLAAIDTAFGSLDQLKAAFNDAGLKQFGSGWAWVAIDPNTNALSVLARPNQDSLYMEGKVPLFGNDVWEHAYYLKYQNRRAEYLEAWWNVLNWEAVAARYDDVLASIPVG